ncbi:MAG: PEP-CTERM sorting domain-containing protein [Nitrococcus mobilis]|nr:PEP-CTERM sorting domain-containing protein [Nitrococcus mobilis]
MIDVTAARRGKRRYRGHVQRVAKRVARAALIRGNLLIAGMGMCLLPALSFAVPVTFTGSSGSLAASASFDISGDNLTIILTNTANYDASTDGALASNQTLSGIFFDLTTDPTLSPVSASIASGSDLVQSDQCDVGPCSATTTDVGGEFIFGTNPTPSEFPNDAMYGIASSGYISGSSGNFSGPNLDDPDAPDGINFGIVPSGFNAGDGNGGLDNDPLIRNAVQLVLTGVSGLTNDAISNVSFQYGTDFDEPNFPGDPGRPPGSIPEPATLFLFGAGLLGLSLMLRRKHTLE